MLSDTAKSGPSTLAVVDNTICIQFRSAVADCCRLNPRNRRQSPIVGDERQKRSRYYPTKIMESPLPNTHFVNLCLQQY
uniref:Uncharacterized protein n=1 Tax=Romanomermis culicivorax TaxID=13658 RepID=A0A915HXC3_ROMCU